jgi:hypothetical protein
MSGLASRRLERRLPSAACAGTSSCAAASTIRPQGSPYPLRHTVPCRCPHLWACSVCPCALRNHRRRGCHPRHTFRPCRSSRLRRLSPRRTLQVCCALLPTMGFTTFPVRLSRATVSAAAGPAPACSANGGPLDVEPGYSRSFPKTVHSGRILAEETCLGRAPKRAPLRRA